MGSALCNLKGSHLVMTYGLEALFIIREDVKWNIIQGSTNKAMICTKRRRKNS